MREEKIIKLDRNKVRVRNHIKQDHNTSKNLWINSELDKQKLRTLESVKNDLLFISHLNLPEKVLGQNFFPRKYHAIFEIYMKDNNDVNFKFKSLDPIENSMKYLDKIVYYAFLKKINEIDSNKLKKILMQLDSNKEINHKLTSTNMKLNRIVDLVFEFDEPEV